MSGAATTAVAMTPYQLRLCVFETLRRNVITKCSHPVCVERLWCLGRTELHAACVEIGERLSVDVSQFLAGWVCEHPPTPHVSIDSAMRAFDSFVLAQRQGKAG